MSHRKRNSSISREQQNSLKEISVSSLQYNREYWAPYTTQNIVVKKNRYFIENQPLPSQPSVKGITIDNSGELNFSSLDDQTRGGSFKKRERGSSAKSKKQKVGFALQPEIISDYTSPSKPFLSSPSLGVKSPTNPLSK